jgi:hypothetical protein
MLNFPIKPKLIQNDPKLSGSGNIDRFHQNHLNFKSFLSRAGLLFNLFVSGQMAAGKPENNAK